MRISAQCERGELLGMNYKHCVFVNKILRAFSALWNPLWDVQRGVAVALTGEPFHGSLKCSNCSSWADKQVL